MKLLTVCTVIGFGFLPHAAQDPAKLGSIENPITITSTDRGPDIDPVEFESSAYTGPRTHYRTFKSFMSALYAMSDVWIYARDDDSILYGTGLVPTTPEFYTPTWSEMFDNVARQMRCEWKWNPTNRQFEFYRSDAGPYVGVVTPDGWSSRDSGFSVQYAPEGRDRSLDIVYFGHFTATSGDTALYMRIRNHFAEMIPANLDNPPNTDDMTEVSLGASKALYFERIPYGPSEIWRQWSVVIDGHALVAVSILPKDTDPKLTATIEEIVKTLTVRRSR